MYSIFPSSETSLSHPFYLLLDFDTHTGLSVGAIIGIVVASCVVVCLILVLLRLKGYLGGDDTEDKGEMMCNVFFSFDYNKKSIVSYLESDQTIEVP